MSAGSPPGARPPRWAETMLTRVLSPEDRQPVLGDLAEELQEVAREEGEPAARRWYVREAMRSVVPALRRRLRGAAVTAGRRRRVGVHALTRRGQSLVRGVAGDLRAARRALARRPRFAVLTAGAYAMGIGVVTATFGLVDDLLLDPLPWPGAPEVVGIWERNDEVGMDLVPAAPAKIMAWRAQADVFSAVAAWRLDELDMTGPGDPERLQVGRVEPELLPLLGIRPTLGRVFSAEEARPGKDGVALLGHAFWVERFGGRADVVGRTLTLDGRTRVIVGVLPQGTQFPRAAELLVPLVIDVPESRSAHAYRVLGRTAPRVDLKTARARMDALAARLEAEHPDTDRGWGITVVPLRDQLLGDLGGTLLLLLAAGGLVFLVACGNAASLLLVRTAGRARELGVRTSLGASRARMVTQLTAESVLLALAGGLGGIVVGRWATAVLLRLAPPELATFATGSFDSTVHAVALALALTAGVVFGLVPALRSTAGGAMPALREGTSTAARGRSRARSVIVATEIALAALLLVGSGLLVRSAYSLAEVDLGFEAAGLLTAALQPARDRYPGGLQRMGLYREVLERTAAIPGVQGAALVSHVPLGGRSDQFRFQVEGRPVPTFADLDVAALRSVTPDYFQVMGIERLEGRSFQEADREDAELVAVVDQAMARRFWPGGDPTGARISFSGDDGPWVRIVGVVESVRHRDPAEPPEPAVYVPMAQEPWPAAWLVLRSARDPTTLADALRRAVAEADPLMPLADLRTGDELVAPTRARWRLSAALVAAFAAVALALAVTGVYGLVAYVVHERTGEIAIRRVLGARSGDVRLLVGGSAFRVASTGIGCGLALAAVLSGLVRPFLFEVGPLDPVSFAAGAGLLLLVALAAAWAPARKASRVDPAEALRAG